MVYMPALIGVPEIVALPLPAAKFTPGGRSPDSVSAAAGKPVVLTLNENAVPMVTLSDAFEVIAGASSTVRMKVWVAVPALPFAFRVMV